MVSNLLKDARVEKGDSNLLKDSRVEKGLEEEVGVAAQPFPIEKGTP